jgi:hypothetical protein
LLVGKQALKVSLLAIRQLKRYCDLVDLERRIDAALIRLRLKTRTTAAGKRNRASAVNRTGETIFLLGGQSSHQQQY